MHGGDVTGPSFDPDGLTGEVQGVGYRHTEHLSGIPVRVVRECGVAAIAEPVLVPRAPFGTHEEIADALIAEHVDELMEHGLGWIGVLTKTVGRVASHQMREQVPLPAAAPLRSRPVQLRVEG